MTADHVDKKRKARDEDGQEHNEKKVKIENASDDKLNIAKARAAAIAARIAASAQKNATPTAEDVASEDDATTVKVEDQIDEESNKVDEKVSST